LEFPDGKKIYGQYRTRKLISDIFNKENLEYYYIAITNDHKKDGINLFPLIPQKLNHGDSINFGWIGFNSIARFNHPGLDMAVINKIIQFNLEE
jgi:hypothetical protein